MILGLLASVQSKLYPLSQDIQMRVFYRGVSSGLFLVLPQGQEAIAIMDSLQRSSFPGYDFVYLDPSLGEIYQNGRNFLGTRDDQLPCAIAVKAGVKYFHEGQLQFSALSEFVRRVSNNEVQHYYKSAHPPLENDGDVKVLVGQTIRQMIYQSDKQIIVDIYSPWCGHCKELQPKYAEAARQFKNKGVDVVLLKLDNTVNDFPMIKVTQYPLLVFFGRDKSKPPRVNRLRMQSTSDVVGFWKINTQDARKNEI